MPFGDERHERQPDLVVLAANRSFHVSFDVAEPSGESLPIGRPFPNFQS